MTELVYGPLNKNIYTHLLELITKCMIHASGKVNSYSEYTSYLDNTKPVEVNIGNIKIDLNDIISKANLNHISINETDSAKLSTYSYHAYYCNAPLNTAEKNAITSYTGSRYYSINQFLHSQATGYHYNVNDIVIDSVLIASGLNKIDPTLNSQFETYRGEHATSYEEIQHRIELVKQGGGWTEQNAFMSTSSDYYVSQNFKGNCFIIFDNVYGKNIQSLSGIPSEDEFLIAPGKILWTKYEYINGDHVFHAKVVNPLIQGADDASIEYYQLFENLMKFAKENGINDDFVTQHLKSTLESYREQGLLSTQTELNAIQQNDNSTINNNIHDNNHFEQDIANVDTEFDFTDAELEKILSAIFNDVTDFGSDDISISLNDCISIDDVIVGLDFNENTTTHMTYEANQEPNITFAPSIPIEHLIPIVQEQTCY